MKRAECIVCSAKIDRIPTEPNAFCGEKCEKVFKKMTGLPDNIRFEKAERGRYPHLVLLSKRRIVRVHVKGDR